MALACPKFLFFWKAYSRIERQVIEFLFQNLGSPERCGVWGPIWNECDSLRTILCWISESSKLQ